MDADITARWTGRCKTGRHNRIIRHKRRYAIEAAYAHINLNKMRTRGKLASWDLRIVPTLRARFLKCRERRQTRENVDYRFRPAGYTVAIYRPRHAGTGAGARHSTGRSIDHYH